MANYNYYTSGFEDVQNWPFSVRYTASPYRKSKFPVDSSSSSSSSAPAAAAMMMNSNLANGNSSASSTNSNCSNNSLECNNGTSLLRPHQQQQLLLQQHQQYHQQQQLGIQNHHQFQQQQQQQSSQQLHWSSAAPHHYDPAHPPSYNSYHAHQHLAAQKESDHHNHLMMTMQGNSSSSTPSPGIPFALHNQNSFPPSTINSKTNFNNQQQQQLFYNPQLQQQYCSFNQVPSQQQSFFQPDSNSSAFLSQDHNQYGLPPQQQQLSQQAKNRFFFPQSNQRQYIFNAANRTQAGLNSATGPHESTPFSVDGVILDEGYIEDLKTPHGLPPGNILLISSSNNGNNSGNSLVNSDNLSTITNPNNNLNNTNLIQQHQHQQQVQSGSFDYNHYSYAYDSQILQPPPQLFCNDGGGQQHHPSSISAATTIIERLRREAAALQAASLQHQNKMAAHPVVNTSPSLSMKQSAIAGGGSSGLPNGKGRLSRKNSLGNNSSPSHGSHRSSFENEYEEINDVARYMAMGVPPMATSIANGNSTPTTSSTLPPPLHFKSFSSTDDILAEVVQVQEGHDRVLDQLNLEVENLLIRSSSEVILETNDLATKSSANMSKYGNHKKGISDSGLSSSTTTTTTMDDHCYCNLATSATIGGHGGSASTSCINGAGDYCCEHSIDNSHTNNMELGGSGGGIEKGSSSSDAIIETCALPTKKNPSSSTSCTDNYCNCCTVSGNNETSGGVCGFYNNMTFANNNTNSVSRKKKLERIFGVHNSNSIDSISKAKNNFKLLHPQLFQQQQQQQGMQQCNGSCDCNNAYNSSGSKKSFKSGIVKSNSCTSSFNNDPSASSIQPKHHRSYSIIPHWKIRDHLMRLPFLRGHANNGDKVKKSESINSLSLSRSKKFKQQQLQLQQGFSPIVPPQIQQLSSTRVNANVGPSANHMATVKARSSSMDELRPTATEEHWYSADSDTDPDSLTLLSAQQQQQQRLQQSTNPSDNGNNNSPSIPPGGISTFGLGNNNTNSTTTTTASNINHLNSNPMMTTPGGGAALVLRRNSTENNNGHMTRHDIGALPDVPKPPKFRRGPAPSGFKEKWRESWTQSKTLSKNSVDDDGNWPFRWFSLRKNQSANLLNNNISSNSNGSSSSATMANSSSNSDSSHNNNSNNISHHHHHQRNSSTLGVLSEEELKRISFNVEDEEGSWQRRTVLPPTLGPPPPGLTLQQIKRRCIIKELVTSENNYVTSLQRLVNEYKKPLEKSNPSIVSHSKISTIFHRQPEILQCHSLFRIALAEVVRGWDTDEKIGEVFIASFSKSLVLDVYSEFINNFDTAMETLKSEAKRKSAFADFLKIKQMTSDDRLSIFGLMVKPVQRFPQFILILVDLLKHTPQDHHDRMALQCAITQLESLTCMLNERKRELDHYQAFRETIKSITGGKFALLRSVVDDANRILLRQDVVTQLEFDSNGGSVAKSKCRKLLLLNDLLICVSLNQSSSSNNSQHGSHERNSSTSQLNNNSSSKNESSNAWSANSAKGEKSVYKWSYRVQEVEVDDISISPTLSRLVPHSSSSSSNKLHRSTSINTPIESESQLSKSLYEEMQNLMEDYAVLSRILTLVSTLKSSYEGLTESTIKELMLGIQHQIRAADEQISYFDSSCLTLLLGNPSSANREKVIFQMNSPAERNEWIEELRFAQLALDPNNSPGWDIPLESPYPHHKLPLFVRSLALCRSPNLATVKCGCFFTHTSVSATGRSKILDYLWVSCTDGISSHVTALRSQQNTLKEVSSFDLMEEKINDLLFVSGHVWIATENSKILIYDPADPDQNKGSVNQQLLSASVIKLTLFENNVYAGLGDGCLAIYTKIHNPKEIEPEIILKLGSERISSLFGSREHVFASCGNAVVIIDSKTHTIEKNVVLGCHRNGPITPITHMACSGVGLWIATGESETICLYHLETLQHLKDVSISPSAFRTVRDSYRRSKGCHVTCMTAYKGWLWIGTNLGVVLTIPLPRLEGVPNINSGKANVALHGYYDPVTFLMPLIKQPRQIVHNTSKHSHTNTKSVKMAPRVEILSEKELQQQKQLEQLEKEGTAQTEISQEKSRNDDESQESVGTNGSSPSNPLNTSLSPQTSISSGLSGSNDGSGNENLLTVGHSGRRSTSLSPSSSITASTAVLNSNKALVVLRKKNSRDSAWARNCKTLPRGGPIPSSLRFSVDSDVYGLYGNLINVRGLEDEGRFVDPLYDAMLRKSDTDLVSLESKCNTMDRRLKQRMRPRSLDMSSWSVDSRVSASSDESGGGGSRLSAASSGSHTIENNSISPPTTMMKPTSDMKTVPSTTTTSATSTLTNASSESALHSATSTSVPPTSTNGTSKKTVARSKPNKASTQKKPETVFMVVGGRGYINMKTQPTQDHYLQHTSSGNHVSETDSKHVTHLMVWQMKTYC